MFTMNNVYVVFSYLYKCDYLGEIKKTGFKILYKASANLQRLILISMVGTFEFDPSILKFSKNEELI